jgi:hypothetical protein
MTFGMNEFRLKKTKGEIAMARFIGDNLTCTVATDEAVALVPAQAVKLISYGNMDSPIMVTAAAADDDIFGFVINQLRSKTYPAKSQLDVTLAGTVMIMEAAGSLVAGTRVGIVAATQKIQDATDMSITPIGILLDKANVDGDLVRVLIQVADRFTVAMIAAAV